MIQLIGAFLAMYGIMFMVVDLSPGFSAFGYVVYILGCYEVFSKPFEPIRVDIGDVI
jgi:hypothetical protein